MKQLVVSLGIFSAYTSVDTVLTTVGLNAGLSERNPLVRTDNLPLHGLKTILLVGMFAAAAHVVERQLGTTRITQAIVSIITMLYVYILFSNIFAIWEVTC